MTNNRPITLQVLNDLHSLQQLGTTFLQLFDRFYPLIKNSNFFLDKIIARRLLLDSTIEVLPRQDNQSSRNNKRPALGNQEALLALFAQLLAPWK